MLLVLDTATDVCAVALVRDGEPVASRWTDVPRAHAARLAPMVAEVLAEAGLAPSDLDAVAVSAGPGSFTGLRIGLSMAKGLCLATGARLALVPTLDAFVDAMRDGDDMAARVLAVLPSRRGEVYVGGDGRAPAAVAVADLADALSGASVALVGPAAPAALAALDGTGVAATVAEVTPERVLAALARLAARRLVDGADDVGAAEPLYVQPFLPSAPAPGR